MKNIIYFMMFLITTHAFAREYVPGLYKIDVDHSKVGFMIPYLIITTVEGKFTKLDGTINLHKNFQETQIEVEVETSSIDTDVTKRDDHLKSTDFFDVEKYPKMFFKSVRIDGPKEHFKLIGDLTIKGITRRVEFDTVFLGVVSSSYGNDKAAFLGRAKINRKDYGINWNKVVEGSEVIGDDVEIELKVLASKPSKEGIKLFGSVLEISGLKGGR